MSGTDNAYGCPCFNENTREAAGASLVQAFRAARDYAVKNLEQGRSLYISTVFHSARTEDDILGYHYDGINEEWLGQSFLLAANPHVSLTAETLVVDQVLRSLAGTGYEIERDHVVRISPRTPGR